MQTSKYWQDRFNMLQESQLKKGETYAASLEEQYLKASSRMEKDIEVWYQRFATNNKIGLTEAKVMLNAKQLKEFKWDVQDYIKYGEKNAIDGKWMKELENASARIHITRLESLKIQLQHQIEKLYGNQIDDVDGLMRGIYEDGFYHSAFEIQNGFNVGYNINRLNEKAINGVISKPWTTDNKTFSDRIWGSKRDLINQVHVGMTQGIIRGDSPKKAVADLASKMKVKNGQAGRLIMTESAFFASAAQRDAFKTLDVEEFEIVATLDSHTSHICQDIDGRHFNMEFFEVGATAPPFHVWCRSTTIPYFEDNLGGRAARNSDGKTYYVPSDMKYKEWVSTFIDNTIPVDDLVEILDSGIIKNNSVLMALKDSIMTKHETLLTDVKHRSELEAIMSGKDERHLTLYDKLTDRFSQSNYYKKGAGYYLPSANKIEMDMNSNEWENRVGTGLTGAFNTKFHEEFHQLDHVLSSSPLAMTGSGRLGRRLTDPDTIIGGKIQESIKSDILKRVNDAIDWQNSLYGGKVKHLKNLDRISSDGHDAFMGWLKYKYPDGKGRAQIAMFTDAMGLMTKDRFSPSNHGFWGHSGKYNKDRGERGSTSETWATFGSLIMNDHAETIAMVQKIMPETWEVMSSTLEQVLDHAMVNDLKY